MGKRLLECFFTGKVPGEGNRAEKQKHRNKKEFCSGEKETVENNFSLDRYSHLEDHRVENTWAAAFSVSSRSSSVWA